jgi:cystathionine beta-lyase
MDFDELFERRSTHSAKWDRMEESYGISKDEGLPMHVAEMDFRPPKEIQNKLRELNQHGFYGYFADFTEYENSIKWWMKTRHTWDIGKSKIFATHGLVNGMALCVDAFTKPEDEIIMFTPMYHAFFNVLNATDRKIKEFPLLLEDGKYRMDFAKYKKQLSGKETMLIFCSPHNPGGRVWSPSELNEVADFCKENELLLVSDEIHHDLIMPGSTHTVMPIAAPQINDHLIMLTANTKTFNIAGIHTGNVIISNTKLATIFERKMKSLGLGPNALGIHLATAGYSEGAANWLDSLLTYLAENFRIFNSGIDKIPGCKAMPAEGTYLAWVDFSGTGMSREEFTSRIEKSAKITTVHGSEMGKGGETYMRFNIATPKSRVIEAVERMQKAFKDLQ